MTKILVVEDVESLRQVIVSVLESAGFSVSSSLDVKNALAQLCQESFDLILSDFRLPQKNGIEFLTEIRAQKNETPFIMMTAFGSIDLAVEAMKQGATDFITKPFEPEQLISSINQILKHKRIIDREAKAGISQRRAVNLSSKNLKMLKVLEDVKKISTVITPVMILGESGTGKELIAQMVHQQSTRRNEPFVAINCGAIPHDLLESELFGHEAGAFTGATQRRIGVFEFASNGTIFLDEIGDMPHSLQVKLLRTLQEHEIRRVGGNKSIKVNPKIISATHQDVLKLIEEGRMREDLYYRLAVVTLNIPSLKERHEDLDHLVDQFLLNFSTKFDKTVFINEESKSLLKNYDWPGNIRELENVIERAVLLSPDGGEILVDNLGIDFNSMNEAVKTLNEISRQAQVDAEKRHIKRTLTLVGGDKNEAAKKLGITSKTLSGKVREYGV